MENRIDQVFKDKLSEHKIAPTPEAWEKVNAGLSKKSKLAIVWRMAAVLALSGVCIGAWYFLTSNETTETKLLTNTEDSTKTDTSVNETAAESVPANVNSTQAQVNKKITTKIKTPIDHLQTKSDKAIENEELKTHEIETILPEQAIAVELTSITQTTKPEKPIVIEFTLESIAKSPVAQVAQVKEEENTGLKKIIEAARDMKNGDTDMSSIRDTKNQLFALGFKKDKTKSY